MGKKKHAVNMMFTILLLGLFALTSIFVAMMGVKVYANSADKMHANFDTRTSIVYLSEKIRTCAGDDFDVRELDGSTALVLSEEVEGNIYESWIFVSDDQLCEATIIKGDTIIPGAAQHIMPLKSFDAQRTSDGIELTAVTMEGDRNTTFICGRIGS